MQTAAKQHDGLRQSSGFSGKEEKNVFKVVAAGSRNQTSIPPEQQHASAVPLKETFSSINKCFYLLKYNKNCCGSRKNGPSCFDSGSCITVSIPMLLLFCFYSFYEVYNDVVHLYEQSGADWSVCQRRYNQT